MEKNFLIFCQIGDSIPTCGCIGFDHDLTTVEIDFGGGVIRKTLDALLKSSGHLTGFLSANFAEFSNSSRLFSFASLIDFPLSQDLEDIHRFITADREPVQFPGKERFILDQFLGFIGNDDGGFKQFCQPLALKQH